MDTINFTMIVNRSSQRIYIEVIYLNMNYLKSYGVTRSYKKIMLAFHKKSSQLNTN